ncbi:hypothetical protein AMAG_19019 [Allomyces macrogynus ATCC 38327]|uniref:Uncharacterized protein n=1 Tax=Allomyces macrogynus (strain ATCC 38327) TaxID=578462 RepID=A0A0L0SM74_ALLM3|nr:hypothetical protein AMAG_19019 [Allomyces macrogynus ATCC 38327]|eukprot:KNE63563.1 hypothetical protein AMAG_19019 [Allomyces macrogynus ATCC 38327]
MIVHPGPTAQVLARLSQARIEVHHDATHDKAFNGLMPLYGLDPIVDGSKEALVPAKFLAFFLDTTAPTSSVKGAVEQSRKFGCQEILKFLSGR